MKPFSHPPSSPAGVIFQLCSDSQSSSCLNSTLLGLGNAAKCKNSNILSQVAKERTMSDLTGPRCCSLLYFLHILRFRWSQGRDGLAIFAWVFFCTNLLYLSQKLGRNAKLLKIWDLPCYTSAPWSSAPSVFRWVETECTQFAPSFLVHHSSSKYLWSLALFGWEYVKKCRRSEVVAATTVFHRKTMSFILQRIHVHEFAFDALTDIPTQTESIAFIL